MFNKTLVNALRQLISDGDFSNQEELCHALEKLGFEVNQSKISRLLPTIGAVKIKNDHGVLIYTIPREPIPPTASSLLHLVLDIRHNETLIVINTSPGSASLVARILDHQRDKLGVIGTVAGDDTIFIAPQSIKDIAETAKKIKNWFAEY